MSNILFQSVNINCRPPRWMAYGYYDIMRNKIVWVAFPLNLIVSLAWWVQDRWARAACAPSWIEREVQSRLDHHIIHARGVYRPRCMEGGTQ